MKKYVMITKAKDSYWYSNEIGNIYEVDEFGTSHFKVVNHKVSINGNCFIKKEHCVEVPCRIGEEAEFSRDGKNWYKTVFLGYDILRPTKFKFFAEDDCYKYAQPIDSKKNEVRKQIERLEEELAILKSKIQ